MARLVLTPRVREAVTAIRNRLSWRKIRRLTLAALAFGFLAIGVEALVRARLGPLGARMPTAVYTRPSSWGNHGRDLGPVLIGTLGRAPAEVRSPVELDALPDHLLQATLAVEDQRFAEHHGLDFRRIGGALVANIRALGIVQGGSTITQQLAKNLFLSAERTPLRKLREAAMALVLEARYDKDAILESYLNEVYLGQDGPRAIHGVGAAARYYFGKDVRRIGVAESALLAGMIQAPNRYNPVRNERWARGRRNLVIALMAEQGRLSQRRAKDAAGSRVRARAHPALRLDARYFRDEAAASLDRRLPARGAAVYTTLDPDLQRAAERAIRDGLGRLRGDEVQAALVAIDPRSGDVLAMVGGRDYGASQFNRATHALRQPGSAFKPIVALAALHKEGDREPAFTLASRIDDEPLSVATPAGRWEPSNYDGSFRGEVTLREAIEQSLNVPFARIGLAVGPARIAATARRLGITSRLREVPSLALGSSEVTLLELVRAYGVFATGGQLATTRMILGRSDPGSDDVPPNGGPPEIARAADPAEAYLVTSALEGVITRGTGRALGEGGGRGELAGKTGTSNNWRDAWFLAYSPSIVVGVWVGYDDGRSLRMSGAGAALPIVARFLDRTDQDDRGDSFDIPDGIEFARVGGGESGWFWDCGSREVFLAGTAPRSECDWRDDRDRDRDDDRWRVRIGGRAGRLIARLMERIREVERDGSDR